MASVAQLAYGASASIHALYWIGADCFDFGGGFPVLWYESVPLGRGRSLRVIVFLRKRVYKTGECGGVMWKE